MQGVIEKIYDSIQKENPYGTAVGQFPVSIADDFTMRKFYEGGQLCALGTGNQALTAGVATSVITKTPPVGKILINPVLTVANISTGATVSVEFKVYSGVEGETEQMFNVNSGDHLKLSGVIGTAGYIKYISLTAGTGVYVAVTISGMLINA